MITFQYFPNNVQSNKALGDITLNKFLHKISSPNKDTVDLYLAIEKATKERNEALRAELKAKLFYFTPAVYLNGGRKYDNIKFWTGLMPLDFDKIHYADEFRDYLVDTYPFIIAAWLSSSKYGVRALARIPVVSSIDEYKGFFFGAENVLGIYEGFDRAPQNCVLPLYLSYDADMKLNENPDYFTEIGVNQKAFKYTIPQNYKPVNATSGHVKYIEKVLLTGIGKITDNGHPQLRAIAVALGGYVGAGYINEHSAHEMICAVIRSNAYLSKKPKVYERTALEMIRYGSTKPLYID